MSNDHDDTQHTWGEVFTVIRVTFSVLAVPFAMLLGALLMLIFTFAAFITHPALALIPVGFVVLGLVLLIRRDKRVQAELEAEIEAGRVRTINAQQQGRSNLFR
jgi:hypothetical protein